MAFTNYLMQSIICTLFFYGYGLDYYNELKYHQLYYVVAAVWVFQIIFALLSGCATTGLAHLNGCGGH